MNARRKYLSLSSVFTPLKQQQNPNDGTEVCNSEERLQQYKCEVCFEVLVFESSQQLLIHSAKHPELVAQFPALRELTVGDCVNALSQRSSLQQNGMSDYREHSSVQNDDGHGGTIQSSSNLCEEETKCEITDEISFNNGYSLADEENTHGESFECIICLKRFSTNQGMMQHVGMTHPELVSQYSTLRELTFADREETQNSSLQENEMQDYVEHSAVHHNKSKFEYDTGDSGIVQSSRTLCEGEGIKCEVSDINNENRNDSVDHMETHEISEKISECIKCHEHFSTTDSFMQHKHDSCCEPEKKTLRFQCKHCSASFERKKKFIEHLKVIHGDKSGGEKLFECDECHKLFLKSNGLRQHRSFHEKRGTHKKKLIECVECHKFFLTRDSLIQHSLKHEENKFQCNNCSSSFRKEVHLAKHQTKVHKDQKEEFVDDADSADNSNLNKHTERQSAVSTTSPELDSCSNVKHTDQGKSRCVII